MSVLQEYIAGSNEFKALEKSFSEGKLSHAYLVVCQDKEYVGEFYKSFAKILLKNGAQVDSDTNPDFITIKSEKNITVSDIEPVISDIYVKPYEEDYKVYVIDDASFLTPEAQNKLLKTLEEPPTNVVLLLVASNDNSILPTIVSRCAKVVLPEINEQVICDVLGENGVQDAGFYAQMCGGNLSRALALSLDSNFKQLFQNVVDMFLLKSSRDIPTFSAKLNLQKLDINEFFDLTISVARDIMMVVANKTDMIVHKMYGGKFAEIAKEFGLESIAMITKNAILAQKNLYFGSNPQMVLDTFLLKMVEVKVLCRK
ncbi:MAG: hypothetical protein IJS68_02930 [Clostridia bacterium]|nr:hypothetical protein [Clostridia bacterium]